MSSNFLINIMTKGAGKSEKQVRGVSSALGGLAKKAALAAGAYFGARALLAGIKSSIDLYKEQELAEVKLRQALGKSIGGLQQYASSLQQVTNFGDELILQGMAQLAFFIKDEEQLKLATQASLDLASAKGMDLVQASDLVAKSVGSSTNALSRYGIAATGAVGSNERLLSITDAIGKTFGGQAVATTKSLSGAIDQMKNSIGDTQEIMGEVLAPIIIKLAKGFKSAAENVSGFIKGLTETSLETTIRELEALGVSSEKLLRLKNIQINRDIRILNAELKKTNKTGLDGLAIEDKLIALADEKIKLGEEIAIIEETMTDGKRRNLEIQKRENDQSLMGLQYSNDVEGVLSRVNEVKTLNAEIDEQTGLQQETRIEQIAREEEELAELALLLAKRNGLELKRTEIIKSQTVATKDQSKAEVEGGKVTSKLAKFNAKALKDSIEGKKKMGQELLAFVGLAKAEEIKEGLRTTYAMVLKAYKFGADKGGPFLGAVFGGLALTAGLAYVAKMKKAQYGADFVTSGPQMMMVGEAGAERVSVTPLEGPNIEGPQGSSIVLNISNPIMSENFVEESVIPQIREGLRLGENLGV